MKIWRKRLTQRMNELINYKAVYRTAPATPCLLIIIDSGGFFLNYLLILMSSNIPHLNTFDFNTLKKSPGKGTHKQTDTQTDFATTRPNRPSGPIWWKYQVKRLWKTMNLKKLKLRQTREKLLVKGFSWSHIFIFASTFLLLQPYLARAATSWLLQSHLGSCSHL